MSDIKRAVIDYMALHYPIVYKVCSEDGTLSHIDTWNKIDQEIKDSKRFHCGMDMSGLTSLLSTIKLERVALGLLPNNVKLYGYQWDIVEQMQDEGVVRNDALPPYTLHKLSIKKPV